MDSYITRASKFAASVGIANVDDLMYGIRKASESTGETPESILARLERETTIEADHSAEALKQLLEAETKPSPAVKAPLFMNRARRRKAAKQAKNRKVVKQNG